MGDRHWRRFAALSSLLLACTGQIEGSGGGAGTVVEGDVSAPGVADPFGSAPGGGPSGAAGAAPGSGSDGAPGDSSDDRAAGVNVVECLEPAVGPTALKRLTHREYDNSVRDLLGDSSAPGLAFAPDTQVGLFDNTSAAQTVSVLLADQYLDAAERLAEGADVDALLGCDPAGADGAACVRGFVERFGRRAYRRPLSATELGDLVGLQTELAALSDARTGVRGVIAAVLASPNFLFRPELGGADGELEGAKQLTDFELAARLASLLWASVPDDTLLDAAAAGQLQDAAGLEGQARRMLDDPRARPALAAFYEQWFGLHLLQTATKDPAAYPRFDDALRASMAEETRRFIEHVLWEDDGRLATLLTAQYSFVDGPLAELYGVAPPADPSAFELTFLDSEQRRGLLSQASLMTAFASPAESSPVKRGKWVRVRILCQDLPDPPAEVPELPGPEPGVTTRERFAMHTDNPACAGCHSMIDGLGFGLEHYDGIGAYRTTDHGAEVDASGEINHTRDIDGLYSGAPELADLLAGSAQVSDCAPTQWFRYALGRRETADDACSLVALQDAFAASGGDLRELMVALTQTDAFRHYRQPE